MKSKQKPNAAEARAVDIATLDREFSAMGAEPSPKKALNRMKAAIARDRQSKTPPKK